jgi:phosphate:Na+ symporter
MNNIETFATMVAGIGLFFSGIKILSSSMKNLASQKLRLLIAKWTQNPFMAAFWGFASGGITQSSSNTIFILVGLVHGRLISVRNSLPVIIWSNVGTTLLIFLVAFNIKLAILILVGFGGIFYGFDKGSRRETVYNALFGISILLFGFQLLKSGSQPFAQMEFIRGMFLYSKDSFIISVLIGIFLRVIIHSSATIAVLIMTLSHAGLIGLDQVILMIVSMSFGEAIVLGLMSSNLKGVSKQIIIFKVIESISTSLLLLIVLSVEFHWNLPIIRSLILAASSNIEQQTAIAFLIFRTAPVLFLSFLYNPIYALLVRLSPPTTEEDLSKTSFITEQSLSDITTALILAENEQVGIFERFSQSIDNIRTEQGIELMHDFTVIHKSNIFLLSEIDVYLKRIIHFNLSRSNSEVYVLLQNRQTLLKSIDETIFNFVKMINNHQITDGLNNLIQNSTESLHVNFITAVEATKSKEQFDIEILLKITEDKGPLMEQVRKFHLSDDQKLSPIDKSFLLDVTDHYQRTVWLLNSWTKTIRSEVVD